MRILFFLFLSFQLIAQDIAWINNIETIRSYSSPRTTDLNNDGVKDVIIGGGVDGIPSAHGINAIDGLNGNNIWTVPTRNEMFTSPQFFDYNGDNIDDILIGGRDAELRLINGANPTLLPCTISMSSNALACSKLRGNPSKIAPRPSAYLSI